MRKAGLLSFTLLLISCSNHSLSAQSVSPYEQKSYPWADSVIATLSLEEQLGQLFMVAAYSNKDEQHYKEINELVTQYHLGGLIFFQGGPVRQANLTNRYQDSAQVPLLIGIDGEWGLAMRLDSTIKYPRQMCLGATRNPELVYEMGKDIARQCKRMGIHVNFAPVADVNNNANNPVINSRAFGEQKELVAQLASAYMRGMQEEHVLATGKHFPGHGDTDSDSHYSLPVIKASKERIEELELYPFREMIKDGMGGVMVAHLYIPALDTTKNRASTLSPKIVTDLLKKELGFKGLIFTDALNMKGVAKYYKPGEVELNALLAGNDVMLFAEDVPKAMELIKQAIEEGKISKEEIRNRAYKVLQTKEWSGLDKYQPIDTKLLITDLNLPNSKGLASRLKKDALTVIKNQNALPVSDEDNQLAIVTIGKINSAFQQAFSGKLEADFFQTAGTELSELNKIKSSIDSKDEVVIAFVNTNERTSRNFGLSDMQMKFVEDIAKKKPTSLIWLGNPYALKKLNLTNLKGVVVGYQDDDETQQHAANLVRLGQGQTGKLPVSINPDYTFGAGMSVYPAGMPEEVSPEEVGFDANLLTTKIDEIVNSGLKAEAYPGCQVVVMRKGKVAFSKSYGKTVYRDGLPINDNMLYDVASLTKVLATTASVMRLVDEGKIDVEKTMGDYLDLPISDEQKKIKIKELLLHQAGFPGWIPFYKQFIETEELKKEYFSTSKNDTFNIKVANSFYTTEALKDSIYRIVYNEPLKANPKYKYSDLGFYYLRLIVEKVTGSTLQGYADSVFYSPMKLNQTTFLPLEKWKKENIVPTEYDAVFRGQLIHGTVHDQAAALLGGVGGHAGLFSTAKEVAYMMQMFLNKGSFAGKQYIKPETIELFTRNHRDEGYDNRRGYGFDKPSPKGEPSPVIDDMSMNSFGHSGFTGTLAWADPDEEIVFVFLSNRVYPSSANKKLIKMNIRSDIHQAIYDALNDKPK